MILQADVLVLGGGPGEEQPQNHLGRLLEVQVLGSHPFPPTQINTQRY